MVFSFTAIAKKGMAITSWLSLSQTSMSEEFILFQLLLKYLIEIVAKTLNRVQTMKITKIMYFLDWRNPFDSNLLLLSNFLLLFLSLKYLMMDSLLSFYSSGNNLFSATFSFSAASFLKVDSFSVLPELRMDFFMEGCF